MICKVCQKELPDSSTVCDFCGTLVEVNDLPEPIKSMAVDSGDNIIYLDSPLEDEKRESLAKKIWGIGITGFIFAMLGFFNIPIPFIWSILGIILPIICLKKTKDYKRLYGKEKGSASVSGKGLAVFAIILSVIKLIIDVVVFVISVATILLITIVATVLIVIACVAFLLLFVLATILEFLLAFLAGIGTLIPTLLPVISLILGFLAVILEITAPYFMDALIEALFSMIFSVFGAVIIL